MKRFLSLLALALGAALPALSQQSPAEKPARAEVLVLGVYHMANPGHDIFNTQADDVLASKRQAEIEQLTLALKRFNPTKIVVEGDVFDTRITENYADYLAGKHELTRNEIEQIGFRLAKELGHKTSTPRMRMASSRGSASSTTPRPAAVRKSSTRSWPRSATWSSAEHVPATMRMLERMLIVTSVLMILATLAFYLGVRSMPR